MIVVAALALCAVGCARTAQIHAIRLDPGGPSARARPGVLTSYKTASEVIAEIMEGELRIPLPREVTVFVYPTRGAYAHGLVEHGGIASARAAEIADYALGLGQPRRLFINDEALRGAPPRAWLGVVAHELTHVAQYELSGGRRGRSDQWLREGMADWVAGFVLERLGESTLRQERERALAALARSRDLLPGGEIHLADLATPKGWETRHLQRDDQLTHRLALVLAHDLIRERGLASLVTYFRGFARSDDRLGNFRHAFGMEPADFESRALDRLAAEMISQAPTETCGGASVSACCPHPGEGATTKEAMTCGGDLVGNE